MDLAEIYRGNFKKYVLTLPINDKIKEIILDEIFVIKNPEFYLYYPLFFSEGFNVSTNSLENLCISGFFYYESSLFLDEVLDQGNTEKLFFAMLCQEECVKILTQIFGNDSLFWYIWNSRREELMFSYSLDKKLILKEKIDFEEYYNLADFKSAFGKAAIDSVYFLSNHPDKELIYKKFLKSHRHFSIAFQINDDILDMVEDYNNKQFNIANYNMKLLMPDESDINLLKKHLYIQGEAKKLYQKAIESIDLAISEVSQITAPLWKGHLESTKKNSINTIIEIDKYIETLMAKINQSKAKVETIDLSESISLSINYLKNTQKDNGSWREYINQGGISDLWSTSFIYTKVFDIDELKEEATKSLLYINQNKNFNDKLWSYNETWITDADSTNFAILSNVLGNQELDNDIFDNWQSFETKSGLFSTYNDRAKLLMALQDGSISNVEHWCSEHQCVSAVAFFIKSIIKKEDSLKLKKYFDDIAIDDITSYWWSSSIYTLYYLALAYERLDDKGALSKICEWILSKQNSDGSFETIYKDDTLFFTGKCIEILLFEYDKYKDSIENGIAFLLHNQFSDGSWDNSSCLLILDPSSKKGSIENFVISSQGINVRAQEFNRLFTTSTNLRTLYKYDKKRYSSHTK